MKKKLLTERFQELAGIKPLYTEQSDTDDYGRSISGKDKRTFKRMEPEDSMPAARAQKMLDNQPTVFTDEDLDELLDIILKYVEDPDDAYDELDRFEDGGFDALSNMVAANLDRDPEYKAWYDKLKMADDKRKGGIPQESEIADYIEGMFNSSVYDYEGIQQDVWSKAEYASTSYGEGSVFMDLVDHLKSVGGKGVLEGNPDIHLELLPNGDIKWSADVI